MDRETLLQRCASRAIVRTASDSEVDLPKYACIKIIECNANEQPYSDGEIFRKIRLYHRKDDKSSEQKWWARLTKTKQKDVQQLLKNHSDLTHAFDSLIDMPGLWYPVQLGTLHRLLTLRCNEVRDRSLFDASTS